MRKLIYAIALIAIFIACEQDYPIILDPQPEPLDTTVIIPNPMDTLVINPSPTDTTMVDPEPMDTTMVDPEPMDTTMIDPEPMDTTMVDPEPMDTTMVDPEPMDTTMVDPEPMDTTMVDPEPMDTTMVDPEPMDTIMVDPEPMDTTMVDPEPMDTTMVDPEPMDTTMVDPEPMDTTMVDPEPMDTTMVDPEPMDTTMVDPEPMDTTMVDPEPMDTTMVDPEPMENLMINGLTYANSDKTFEEANIAIIDAINSLVPVKVVAEIDHTENAASIDQTLNPTKVILFGNPMLGTPLMQKNQLAGLDLPQKLLLFHDDKGQLKVAYNSTDYLSQRHGLQGVESLNGIASALANFSLRATTEELIMGDTSIDLMEGIEMKKSNKSFDATYDKLVKLINAEGGPMLIEELDHQANAASVDLELPPTKLVIFGNPVLGTPLMQNNPTVGIDLPLKMLVYENEAGEVYVAYSDATFLAKRHDLTGNENVLMMISNTLFSLSNGAIN